MKMLESKVSFTVRIDADVGIALDRVARDSGCNRSTLIERAVREYLVRREEGQKARGQLVGASMAAA